MKTVVVIFLTFILAPAVHAQVPAIYYDFENNSNRTILETVPEQAMTTGNTAVTRGSLLGYTLGSTTGAGTSYNYGGSQAGTGITSNGWPTSSIDPGVLATEYFQLTIKTTGLYGLSLSFDMDKDNNGQSPRSVGVLWSTNGVLFSQAAASQNLGASSYQNLVFNLPAGAENKSAVTLRIYAYDSKKLSAYSNFDNFTVWATTITGIANLLDFEAYGLSLSSGTANTPKITGDLTISGGGTALTLSSKMNMDGSVSVSSGAIFGFGTAGLLTGNGDVNLADGSTLQISSTSAQGALKGTLGSTVLNLSPNATVEYNSSLAKQYQDNATLSNVTVNNANGLALLGDLNINGNLALKGGTLSLGSNKLTLKGSLSRTAGVLDAAAGELEMAAATTQSIPAGAITGSVKNLTINNVAGVSTVTNTTVTGTLFLAAGTYNIGSTTQTIKGAITRLAGTMDATSGTLLFNGTGAQSLPAGTAFTAIRNLTVNNAAGVTINDNYTITSGLVLQAGSLGLNGKSITIGGTVSGSGTFTGSATSAITVAAAATAGTLNFDQTSDGLTNALAALTISSGTATLGSKLHLYTALNITGGTINLAGKNLVLKSTATQTAYVGPITGTLNGETNVTVERYIPAWSSRRYRLVTAPVLNTTINAAWQESGRWNGSSAISANGYGTLITGQQQGTAVNANSNGFDFWAAIANSSASIRTFVGGTGAIQGSWLALSSTLTPNAFDNHQAYLLYIRGDRSLSAGTTPGVTVLRATGTLKKGNYLIPVPVNQSFTLVGNPYAAPIDFKQIYDANSTKIQSSFYIWQAGLGTGTGGYVLVRPVSAGSSLYETVPGNGVGSVNNRLIHPGEGFFVAPSPQASSTNLIMVQESHKSTATPAVSVFREMDQQLPAKLYVNLTTGSDSSRVLLDGVLAQYATTDLQESAVVKSSNTSENLAISKNTSDLIFAASKIPASQDTIRLRLWNTTIKDYQLEVKGTNFGANGMSAVLLDQYLNQEKPVSLNDSLSAYNFSVTSDPASKDQNRFLVVLKTAQILPLSITGIRAEETTANTVNVRWNVTDESTVQTYVVEKSTDGTAFREMAVLPSGKSSGTQEYSCIDKSPEPTNFYRIKIISITNETRYSSIVKLQLKTTKETVRIYPNPVNGSLLHVQLQNKPAALYQLTLYNTSGQTVAQHSIVHNGGTATEAIPLSPNLAAGQYRLEVRTHNNLVEALNVSLVR